jgi:hypothetical protein
MVVDCLKSAQRIFPDATRPEFAPEFCELRRNPTHLSKTFEKDVIDLWFKKTAHQQVHCAPMIVRHEVRLPGEVHLLQLLDVHSHAKQHLLVSVQKFQWTPQRRRRYPFCSKTSNPRLSRRDRVFHQRVTRLEMLCSAQLIRLPTHFLHLTALHVDLRTRVNK